MNKASMTCRTIAKGLTFTLLKPQKERRKGLVQGKKIFEEMAKTSPNLVEEINVQILNAQ